MKKGLLTIIMAVMLIVGVLASTKDTYHAVLSYEQQKTNVASAIGYYSVHGKTADETIEMLLRYKKAEGANAQAVNDAVEMGIDYGYYANDYQLFKDAGLVDADYVYGGAAAPAVAAPVAPAVAAPVAPEEFTVETYAEPKTIWATQIVNCRSGASTSYEKVGSLKEYEEVKVTGVASTGWFEITKEDGTKVYVSNKYLSEENPSDRTVYDYNEETGKVDTYEFKDTPPELIDEKVAEIKATAEPTAEPTAAPTIAPTAVPTIEPTAELVDTMKVSDISDELLAEQEPEVQKEINSWKYFVFAGIGFCVLCVVLAIIMIVKGKKKKPWEE